MRTYEKVSLYRITNDIDDARFHGYTTTSISSRLSSLKREAAECPKYTSPVHVHINKLGKEHFKITHVATLGSVTLDEVRARLAELEPSTDPKREPKAEPLQTEPLQNEPLQTVFTLPTEDQRARKTTSLPLQMMQPREAEAEFDYKAQKYLGYVHGALFYISETGAMYEYLEKQDINQLELLSKYIVIEWILLHPTLSLRKKHEAVQTAISSLKKHLEELYITHSIEWSRLCKRDQIVYDQLKDLTKYSDGLSDIAVQHLMSSISHIPQEGPAAPSLAGMQPEQFDISDEDEELNEEEPPLTTPIYDLTDDKFNVLHGKLKQNDINRLIQCYNKTVELEMHLKTQPDDSEAKADHTFFKESLAKRIAELRFDRNLFGLDINCLNLFDSIEKDTHVSNRMRKKFARDIEYIRKHYQTNE